MVHFFPFSLHFRSFSYHSPVRFTFFSFSLHFPGLRNFLSFPTFPQSHLFSEPFSHFPPAFSTFFRFSISFPSLANFLLICPNISQPGQLTFPFSFPSPSLLDLFQLFLSPFFHKPSQFTSTFPYFLFILVNL